MRSDTTRAPATSDAERATVALGQNRAARLERAGRVVARGDTMLEGTTTAATPAHDPHPRRETIEVWCVVSSSG